MSEFDFIPASPFKTSLDTDFVELLRVIDAGAWKSAAVLAGSIVEALLIDYLQSTPSLVPKGKDPLKLDLAEAISICRDAKVLSQRTCDLCSVIRSYRNLIHPGRAIRLQEDQPSKDSATIAASLVKIIVEEVSQVRRASVGLTAEQVCSKLKRDAGALHILPHLLKEVSDLERERLLNDVLPQEYVPLKQSSFGFETQAPRLATAFRSVFSASSEDIQRRISLKYVSLLREADGDYIETYETAFFRAQDIKLIPEPQRSMVVDHLYERATGGHSYDILEMLEGLSAHLTHPQLTKWIDALFRTATSTASSSSSTLRKKASDLLTAEAMWTQSEMEAAYSTRVADWVTHFSEHGQNDKVAIAQTIQKRIAELLDPPF